LRYLDEWSPELDLKILARVALRRRPRRGGGAARAVRPATTLALCLIVLPALVDAQTAADAVTPYVNASSMVDLDVDATGRLWIASAGGALRFDPADETWTVFPRLLGTGPRGNDLSTLCIDAAGRVWTGSATRGFTFYDPLTQRWDRESEEWPDPRIRVIRCLGTGVYIGTRNGFALKPTLTRTDLCAEADPGCIVPSYVINDFAFVGDTLWVATENGLGRFNGTAWDPASSLPAGSTGHVSRSLAVYQGELWEATANQIKQLSGGVWQIRPPFAHRLVVEDGTLYALSTYQVYFWNGTSFQDLEIPFPHESTVRDITVMGGMIYAALDIGLARYGLSDSSLVYYTPPGPALSGFYSGVAVDASGGLWAGTSQRRVGIVRFDGDDWSLIPSEPLGSGGLGEGWILGMHADGAGRVWVAHCCCPTPTDCPLQVFQNGNLTTVSPVLNARGFDTDPSGRLWAGTQGRGVYGLAPAGGPGAYDVLFNLTTTSTGGALSSSSTLALAATSRHAYLGHETQGVDVWPHGGNLNNGQNGSNWFHLGAGQNGLLDDAVGAMTRSGEDVWIGTSTGIHRVNSGVVLDRCPTRDRDDPLDLPRRVNALVTDRQGGLWIGTDRDLVYLPRGAACDETGGAFRFFNVDNTPMPSNQVLAGDASDADGSVWFGTPEGLFQVDPAGISGAPAGEEAFLLYPNPLFPASSNPALRRVVFGVKTGGSAVAPVPAGDVDRPEVFDLTGRRIGAFVVDTGTSAWVWNGTNENGDTVAPGIYLVRAGTAAGETVVRRLGVIR
jgi:ligand-binding sensor domain-containing protein